MINDTLHTNSKPLIRFKTQFIGKQATTATDSTIISGMRKRRGFTLIELMVVLAVTGIMLGFGVPRLTAMLQGNRTAASINSLIAHLNYARNEAVRRSTNVSVIALDRNFTNQWDRGWTVFVDPNADGIIDNGEQQLKIVEALAIPNFTIRPSIGPDDITYNRLGTATQSQFTFTKDGKIKTMSISNTGHVRIDCKRWDDC